MVLPAARFQMDQCRSEPPINIPASMRSIRSTSPDRFSLTGGGRFNVANIVLQDQLGTALNGSDNFTRFNPIIGGTYKITSGVSAYAGYSEANRAPTPLELGCADPAHPCIIAAFLVSDPPLKQVVSHTVEAGFRGNDNTSLGAINWKLGAFRAENTDDILNIPSPVLQGFGYFQNVGSTLRQGFEAEFSSRRTRFRSPRAIRSSTLVSSMPCNSGPIVRLPMKTVISRSCPATNSPLFRATG